MGHYLYNFKYLQREALTVLRTRVLHFANSTVGIVGVTKVMKLSARGKGTRTSRVRAVAIVKLVTKQKLLVAAALGMRRRGRIRRYRKARLPRTAAAGTASVVVLAAAVLLLFPALFLLLVRRGGLAVVLGRRRQKRGGTGPKPLTP